MSVDTNANITWTPLLEAYFKKVAEQSQCYAWLYNHAEGIYSKKRTMIDIPSNILSSITGFISVGSSTLFPDNTKLASIALGAASLIVSIMNMVRSYFLYDKKAEGCKNSAYHFGKLYRWVSVELGLPQEERRRPDEFLKFVRDTYEDLSKASYALPPESIEAFKKRFSVERYLKIHKPEIANGLEEVAVYFEPEKPPPPTPAPEA